MNILVVEDDEDISQIISFNLEMAKYTVRVCSGAEEVLALNVAEFDLILLDVMMGQMSGFSLAQVLKSNEKTKQIPIIFITAMDSEEDIVKGFNLGADDYISKPFSISVLLMRVKAVLSRTNLKEPDQVIEPNSPLLTFEQLYINQDTKRVYINEQEVEFTQTEFDILTLFISNQSALFSRQEIIQNVWGCDVVITHRTVDVHLTRLRKKLGIYGKCIQTRSKYGYCWSGEQLNGGECERG